MDVAFSTGLAQKTHISRVFAPTNEAYRVRFTLNAHLFVLAIAHITSLFLLDVTHLEKNGDRRDRRHQLRSIVVFTMRNL